MNNKIKDFSDFKNAVKQQLENRPMACGLLAAVVGTSVPMISAVLFEIFLESNYKKRFEENKNDTVSINNLVKEAVKQIKQKYQ